MAATYWFIVELVTGHIVERRIQRDDLPSPPIGRPGRKAVQVREEDYGKVMNDNRWDIMNELRIPPGLRNSPAHDKIPDDRRAYAKGLDRITTVIETERVRP